MTRHLARTLKRAAPTMRTRDDALAELNEWLGVRIDSIERWNQHDGSRRFYVLLSGVDVIMGHGVSEIRTAASLNRLVSQWRVVQNGEDFGPTFTSGDASRVCAAFHYISECGEIA